MNMTVNVRFLGKLIVLLVVLVFAVDRLHRRQIGLQADTFLQVANGAERNADAPRMISYLSRYLAIKPHDASARARVGFAKARISTKAENLLDAMLVLEQALRDDPEREDVRRKCVYLGMSLGLQAEALGHLAVLLEAHPNDGDLFDLKAQCAAVMGEWANASDLYRRAIALKPDMIQSYGRLASILRYELKKISGEDGADAVIEALVKVNEKVAGAHLIRANYWNRFGNFEEAEKSVQMAQRLSPNDPEVLLTAADFAANRAERARQSLKMEESKKALAEAARLLQHGIDWNPPPDLTFDQSEDEREAARSRRDLVAQLNRQLVALYVRSERFSEAEKLAWIGAERFPEQAGLLVVLADVLILRAKWDEAEEVLAKLEQVNYPAAILDFHRARLQIGKERWLQASVMLERAAPGLTSSLALAREAYFLLGQCYEQLGETDRSYDALMRSRPSDNTDPLWARANMAVAAALAEKGRRQEAIDTYQSVVRLYPVAALPLARLLLTETIRQAAAEKKPLEKIDWTRIERVVDAAPESLEKQIFKADMSMTRGRADEAKKTLDSARATYENHIDLWVAYTVHAFIQKDMPTVAQYLSKAAEKFGDQPEIRLARARFLAPSPALDLARQLIILANGAENFTAVQRRMLWRGLSDRALELGQRELAKQIWENLVKEQPDNLGVHFRRFDWALEDNDEGAIQTVLADIQRVDGQDGTSARMALAMYLVWKAKRGDKSVLDRARDLLVELKEKRSGWSRIPLGLAVVYDLQGETDAAIPEYQLAVDLGEKSPAVIEHLIEMYYGRQLYNEADLLFKNLPDALRDKQDLQVIAAEIALGARDHSRALEMAEKAVSSGRKDYKKLVWLGRVRWLSGMDRNDIELPFQQAIEFDRSRPDAWIALAQYRAQTGHKGEAEKLVDEARQHVEKKEVSFMLAILYEIVGRTKEARQWFDKALVERPDHIATLRAAANFRVRQIRDTGELREIQKLLERILEVKFKSHDDAQFARRMLGVILAMSTDLDESRRGLEVLGVVDQSQTTPTHRLNLQDMRARAVALALQRTRNSVQDSIHLLEQIDAKKPLPADDQFLLAQLYRLIGEEAQAERRLARVVDSARDNMLYVGYYTDFLIRKADSLAEARRWLAVLEEKQPDAIRTHDLRFRLRWAEGDDKKAVADLVAFVRRLKELPAIPASAIVGALPSANETAYPQGLLVAARLLEEFKQTAESERLYQQALSESENPANIRLLLAEFYARQNRNREALDAIEAAAPASPPMAAANVGIGVLYTVDRPQADDIRRVRNLLLRHLPKGTEPFMEEAALQNLEGDYGSSIASYRRVLERDPKNVLAANNLAFLLAFYENKQAEALELVRKAKTQLIGRDLLLDTEATILMREKPEGAIDLLLEAILLNPSASSYFHLAQVRDAQQQTREAAEAFARAEKLGLRISTLHPLERTVYQELVAKYSASRSPASGRTQ